MEPSEEFSPTYSKPCSPYNLAYYEGGSVSEHILEKSNVVFM